MDNVKPITDEALNKIIERLPRVTPGPWSTDAQKMEDAPDRHDEYTVFDASGRAICGTENSDWRLGEIHRDGPDEDGFSSAWNEPSRVNSAHIASLSPDVVLAIKARIEAADVANAGERAKVADLETQLSRLSAQYGELFDRWADAIKTMGGLHVEVARLEAQLDDLCRKTRTEP